MSRSLSAFALLVLPLAACHARDVSAVDHLPHGEARVIGTASTERLLDILFVVDNSTSMTEEQDSLATNFKAFMNVLAAVPGGLPSVHVGVVSSDVGVAPFQPEGCRLAGDDGLLQNTPRIPGCTAMQAGARFIEDVPSGDTRQKNYAGELDAAFQCIAKLGTDGCGYEQHLEAMRLALDGSRPENAGFLRRDAYLAVVILADEDDCSARDHAMYDTAASEEALGSTLGPPQFLCTEYGLLCDGAPPERAGRSYTSCEPRGDSYLRHPEDYLGFLRSLKDDPSLLITAVIAGSPSRFDVTLSDTALEMAPTCNNAKNGKSYPAARLAWFAGQFGEEQGRFVTICQDDLSDAMIDIAELISDRLSVTCLPPEVEPDVEAAAAGRQPECSVADTRFGVETPLARCRMRDAQAPERDVLPCWWIDDSDRCGSGLAVAVERAQDAPAGTKLLVRCAVQP
jgi:hypothetical protein